MGGSQIIQRFNRAQGGVLGNLLVPKPRDIRRNTGGNRNQRLLVDVAHRHISNVNLCLLTDGSVEIIDNDLHLSGFVTDPFFPVFDDGEVGGNGL